MSRALVSGASIAGLSAAYWLSRAGWEVTVLERASRFRDGGQNVDVRGVGREVLDRMGLMAAARERNTTETATVMVDEHGEVRAELPSEGPDGATAELEILRGDLARIVLEVLPDEVDVRFGDTIAAVDDTGDEVVVTTEGGQRLTADLLVVAEGVRSSTRDLLFDDDEVDRRELGITMAFGTIPRTEDDDDRWRWYTTTGGRQVHLRPDPVGTTRAILAHARDVDLTALDRDDVLARLRAVHGDAGWEAPRVLDGFATTDDLYVDHLTQIRMDAWHRGRTCVVGDAAWCVTPMGGGGATLALVSGYVLAAYLATEDDLATALERHETWMRPLVDQIQGIPRGVTRMAFPESRLGLLAQDLVLKVMTSPPLRGAAERFSQVADTDQELPPWPAPGSPSGAISRF